jgi:hypothetical protein
MDRLELKLCDIQGRLFELSAANGYDSEKFIASFMKSKGAKSLDSAYNRMQWTEEEYLLEELADEENEKLTKNENVFPSEMMYWIGYVDRYWHDLKGETSVKIYLQANAKTLQRNYMMFHTMDPQLAIEDLIEIKGQKQSSAAKKVGSSNT